MDAVQEISLSPKFCARFLFHPSDLNVYPLVWLP